MYNYAKRKEKKRPQDGYSQAQKKIEKKSSQKEIIYFLVGFENTQEQTEDPRSRQFVLVPLNGKPLFQSKH